MRFLVPSKGDVRPDPHGPGGGIIGLDLFAPWTDSTWPAGDFNVGAGYGIMNA